MRHDALGILVEAGRTSDQCAANRDVAGALRAWIVQAELADVLGDLVDELEEVARRLAERRSDECRVVVASAEIPGTTQSAHDLRADHSLARVRRLRAERLPIGFELDDLEQQQRDRALVSACDREIAAHELLEVAEAHEPGARVDSIEARDLLPRTAELALQQRDLDVGRGLNPAVNDGLLNAEEVLELAARVVQRLDAHMGCATTCRPCAGRAA